MEEKEIKEVGDISVSLKEQRNGTIILPIPEAEEDESVDTHNNDIGSGEQLEESDISDVASGEPIIHSQIFKWLTRITSVDLRIKCDMFEDQPKVHLEITLSSGRHLSIDNVRQSSDDTIENVTNKSKTFLMTTYKGKDLLKIKCTNDSKNFIIFDSPTDKPISTLHLTYSLMEVHNLVSDEWYFVDISNRRSKLMLVRNQDGMEIGRITGFGELEPQSSSTRNVIILKPKLKFTEQGIDSVQKAILMGIVLALGLTFDVDVKKTADAFNLIATFLLMLLIVVSVVTYRNADIFNTHSGVVGIINVACVVFVLGILYLIRCCLR